MVEPAGFPGLSEVEGNLREPERTSATEVSSGVRTGSTACVRDFQERHA